MDALSEREAYLAMFAFLEGHWMRTKSEEVAGLLGSLSLLPDGQPADAGVWGEWRRAVTSAKGGEVGAAFRLETRK